MSKSYMRVVMSQLREENARLRDINERQHRIIQDYDKKFDDYRKKVLENNYYEKESLRKQNEFLLNRLSERIAFSPRTVFVANERFKELLMQEPVIDENKIKKPEIDVCDVCLRPTRSIRPLVAARFPTKENGGCVWACESCYEKETSK